MSIKTVTGREIPPPKLKGRIEAKLRLIDQWLADQVVEEAESRGDDFVATMFRGVRSCRNAKGHIVMSQFDRDAANEYLFGSTDGVMLEVG